MAQSTSSTSGQSQPNKRTKFGLFFGAIALVMTGIGYLVDIFDVWEFIEDRLPTHTQEEVRVQPPRGVL